jgi:transcriptional regulator with XRE-family HTH domain
MLHQQLEQARLALGLTREQLAERSGLQREQIRRLETGANFTRDTLLRVLPHLPGLRTLDLGPAELRVGGVDVAELREAVTRFVEQGRELVQLLEQVVIVTPEEAAGATRIQRTVKLTPELEERLRRLEAQVAEARAADDHQS